jgi:predicted DNA-binding transcriptional regulator YafY
MKIDRLLAITMLLVNRSRISAKELADHFEVNVRTIYRDIDALNQAGIPVIAYQGVNGGYGIMENYKIDKNVLTADEISSIITALKGISSTVDDRKISNTLEKIKGLIPSTELDKLKKKSSEVIIDFSPWGASKIDKSKYDTIKNAIGSSNLINFLYTNSKGESIHRSVEPSKMIFKGGSWYLAGYCLLKGDFRIFKLTRMKDIHVSSETFIPREETIRDFPWEKGWDSDANSIELALKFSPSVRARIEDSFNADEIKVLPDGSLIVNVIFPESDWIYGMVLSYGESVEVLAPEYVRNIIKQKAEKILEKY